MKLLKVKIDNLSKKEIKKKINYFLEEKKFHQIVTLNPEFILLAQKDENFFSVLNDSDLRVIDGFGIQLVSFLKGQLIRSRWAGIDLMKEILEKKERKKLKIFFLFYKKGLTQWKDLKKTLNKKYQKLKVQGVSSLKTKQLDLETQKKILKFSPDIVFCNWGAPEQEIILYQLKNYSPRLVMGVGGSFDFLSGKIKRAPKWIRKIGLEWLYRLGKQPWRWRRIVRSVIIFPWKALREKNNLLNEESAKKRMRG